jgi:hypothetical protein
MLRFLKPKKGQKQSLLNILQQHQPRTPASKSFEVLGLRCRQHGAAIAAAEGRVAGDEHYAEFNFSKNSYCHIPALFLILIIKPETSSRERFAAMINLKLFDSCKLANVKSYTVPAEVNTTQLAVKLTLRKLVLLL